MIIIIVAILAAAIGACVGGFAVNKCREPSNRLDQDERFQYLMLNMVSKDIVRLLKRVGLNTRYHDANTRQYLRHLHEQLIDAARFDD